MSRDIVGRAPRLLVFGDVVDDVLVRPVAPITPDSDTPARIVVRPGGSAANQAAWLGWLGATVSFVGRVGAADAERHGRELRRCGVDARLVADSGAGTGTIVILSAATGERTMFTDRGANIRLGRDDVSDELLAAADHLHLTGYSFFEQANRAATLAILDAARRRSLPFSVDPGSAAFLANAGPARFLDWIAGAAAVFPNEAEAALLGGARELAERCGLAVVTRGGNGAVVAARGRPETRVPAPDVECVDPTGAGDAFCAGFLRARLKGAGPVGAARAGAAVAAVAVSHPGARPPMTTSRHPYQGTGSSP